MVDLRCKRRPAYVHAPGAIRELVRPLLEYGSLEREALCLQAASLAGMPVSRVLKCLECASDSEKTWRVYEVALSFLLRKINLTSMHPSDIDATTDMFLALRFYTFEVPLDKLRRALGEGRFGDKRINNWVRKTILGVAEKVAKGVTPKMLSGGDHWEDDIIDDWLEQAG